MRLSRIEKILNCSKRTKLLKRRLSNMIPKPIKKKITMQFSRNFGNLPLFLTLVFMVIIIAKVWCFSIIGC